VEEDTRKDQELKEFYLNLLGCFQWGCLFPLSRTSSLAIGVCKKRRLLGLAQ
jgi:hypothetical protein